MTFVATGQTRLWLVGFSPCMQSEGQGCYRSAEMPACIHHDPSLTRLFTSPIYNRVWRYLFASVRRNTRFLASIRK